jgi:hypothetical protein
MAATEKTLNASQTQADDSRGAIARVLSAAGAVTAARFEGSALLSGGQINIIALDGVVARLGERWPAKRDQVYAHLEAILARKVGANGSFQRVSDTDFLIAQPDVGPFGAQSLCLRCLSELLAYFFGRAEHDGHMVHRVTHLSARGIEAIPVDPVQAARGESQEIKDAAAAAGDAAGKNLFAPGRWSPFVADNGRTVRVSCVLEPVFELKTNHRIGYRLRRRVLDTRTGDALPTAEVNRLSRSDLLRMDMATIARGLLRLESTPDGEQQLSLIVPVSHVSLSNHVGRHMLAQGFAQARLAVRRGIICEVCDIEDVPQVVLVESVALIRPSCLFVIGHPGVGRPDVLPPLKDTGFRAVSFDCPQVAGDAEFIGWLRSMMQAGKKVSNSVMVYRCQTQRHMALAGMLGATHASLAVPTAGNDAR